MKRLCALLAIASAAACAQSAPRTGAIIVAITNSPAVLDPRIGTDVNDIAPDIVWQLREEGRLPVFTAPGTDYAYMWYRVNVAVSQPDIRGVSLSPIADFTFLKNVSRVSSAQ